MNTQKKISYVLVHGGNMSTETWNKLAEIKVCTPDGKMGGKVWNTITPLIEEHDHLVFAPTLLDEHSSTLTEHIDQIKRLILTNNLDDVVLVGHSYGGMIITGVAAELPDKIRSMVYVDAAVPDPGQSLFDIIASGGCDPLSFNGLEPVAPYIEKLDFDALKIKKIPKTYILCTESIFADATKVATEKIASNREGWTYYELKSSHVPMATMPKQLLKLILKPES